MAMAMPEHILVVEDDKDLRDSLADALRLEGYDVVGVEHGEAALQHLSTGARPCVILLDLMMPVMDGWTFHREIQKDQSLAAIPVVVMTAAGAARASTVDVNAVLHKPLQMDSVVEVVQEHCPGGTY
jgi:two-component system, chemotaxis family, chemotaxis protein CheY